MAAAWIAAPASAVCSDIELMAPHAVAARTVDVMATAVFVSPTVVVDVVALEHDFSFQAIPDPIPSTARAMP